MFTDAPDVKRKLLFTPAYENTRVRSQAAPEDEPKKPDNSYRSVFTNKEVIIDWKGGLKNGN
jgi:hypothetical protein